MKFCYIYKVANTVKELKIKNPYFKAFAFEKNKKDEEEIQNEEYVTWINNKWREWCELTGSDYHTPKKEKEHLLFKKWLFDMLGLNDDIRRV